LPQNATVRDGYRVAQHTGEEGQPHGAGQGAPLAHAGETHAGTATAHEGPTNPLAEYPSFYYSAMGLLVAIALILFAVLTTRGLSKRGPSRRQTLIEQAVDSMTWFTRNAIGPGGEKFTPLIGTVFSFVLLSNLMGALPFVFRRGHEEGTVATFTPAPTANLSMTIAISLVVFVVVQWVGIKENGVKGYFKHFAGPVPAISPLLFPLELFGAFVKPISLSIRLFGNVFGEETVIAVLVGLAATVMAKIFLPLPFQLPMLMFGVFGSIIQAGVYTILTCAYISLSIGDHEDHGHGEEHGDVKDEFGAHVPTGGHAHAH
jgi:F-type H+-transporting ATPase subunit a